MMKMLPEDYKDVLKNTAVHFIECARCKRLHDPNEETFVTFYGNVTIGRDGGIIGNNFDKYGKLKSARVYCRSFECLEDIINYMIGGN